MNAPLTLNIVIAQPAPPGGATFQSSSDDPSVVAAGDRQQGFLPRVFIPEGETLSDPFTIFGISVGQTLLRLTPLTPGFSQNTFPLGAWDVNKGGNEKFVDANPPSNHCRVNDGSTDFATDPAVLAQCGRTVANGVAADGVTKLLMRTLAGLPGTVCYEITSTSSLDQGSLQAQVLGTQAVGDKQYGFTLYTAPAVFGTDADTRTLEFEFTFTPNIGNGNTTRFRATTTIVRPPVALVHGIWSGAGAWGSDYKKENTSRTTFIGDYSATNGQRFATNSPHVQDYVKRALDAARAKGYAATQADVMGHSMGGILTRLYVGSPQFARPDNLGKGDIRRLVTLDTPHAGSTFANLVTALHRVKPPETDSAVQSITGFTPAGGAVCDLAENSTGLQGLNSPTTIAAQAVTGTGGPAGSVATPARFFGGVLGFKNIEGTLTRKRCLHRNVFFVCDLDEFVFPQDIVDAFRFRQANDTIVALSDQQGGLAGVNFANVIHSGPGIVHGVLATGAVATSAYQLLDGPTTGFASGFPGVGSAGTGVSVTVPGRGAAQDQSDYANQCSAGGGLALNGPGAVKDILVEGNASFGGRLAAQRAMTADSRVKISSPAQGQVFAPGATVNIVVQITPPLVANDIAVIVPGFAPLAGTNYDGTQYQASFVIPSWFSGALALRPEITDTSNALISGVGVTIGAVPPPPPLGIALQQKNFRISLPTGTASESLAVIGTYPNALTYDLTSSITGTTYQSTNTNVVTVDSEGVYQIVGPGIAVIRVTNSGVSDYAVFVVEDSANPLPPMDVSGQFTVKGGGLRLDRTSGFFVQEVVVSNQLDVPVPGPLYLLIDGLPAGVNLVNEAGISEIIHAGVPFVRVPLSDDGLTVQPKGSRTIVLRFLDPGRTNVVYSSSVHFASQTP